MKEATLNSDGLVWKGGNRRWDGEGRGCGRRPKVVTPAAEFGGEDAVRQLQERGQQRAEGSRMVGLFAE